jgi:hypothetical protein
VDAAVRHRPSMSVRTPVLCTVWWIWQFSPVQGCLNLQRLATAPALTGRVSEHATNRPRSVLYRVNPAEPTTCQPMYFMESKVSQEHWPGPVGGASTRCCQGSPADGVRPTPRQRKGPINPLSAVGFTHLASQTGNVHKASPRVVPSTRPY